MQDVVAVDVGGTHMRLCRACIGDDGTPHLGTIHKYRVADFPDLTTCWRRFLHDDMGEAPHVASIAFAAPIKGQHIKLTNNEWLIRPDTLAQELGVTQLVLVNDFEAMGHAVSRIAERDMERLFGPGTSFPSDGTVTILGVGTGLGVGILAYKNAKPHVIAAEGGHMDFAPTDPFEDGLLDRLRRQYGQVSVERVVSGPGLAHIYHELAHKEHADIELLNDADLWAAALDDTDRLARQALDRLCLSYGSVAGDLALAHGASAVVIVGGLSVRMKNILRTSGFHARFVAKDQYTSLMRSIPVHIALHDDIGLFGAAAAFGAQHAWA